MMSPASLITLACLVLVVVVVADMLMPTVSSGKLWGEEQGKCTLEGHGGHGVG